MANMRKIRWLGRDREALVLADDGRGMCFVDVFSRGQNHVLRLLTGGRARRPTSEELVRLAELEGAVSFGHRPNNEETLMD